jgi:hypothetical protein
MSIVASSFSARTERRSYWRRVVHSAVIAVSHVATARQQIVARSFCATWRFVFRSPPIRCPAGIWCCILPVASTSFKRGASKLECPLHFRFATGWGQRHRSNTDPVQSNCRSNEGSILSESFERRVCCDVALNAPSATRRRQRKAAGLNFSRNFCCPSSSSANEN